MNLKIILFTTVLFSLLISCSQEKERGGSQSEENRSLKISDEEIKFSIPNNFNGKSFQIQYIEDRNQLVVFNLEVAEILFFDIASGDLIKKIKIKKDGPNGIIRPESFHYLSEDSLVVSSFLGLYFIDDEAEIQSKIVISELDNYDEIQDIWLLKSSHSEPRFEIDYAKDRILVGAQLGGTYEYNKDFIQNYKSYPLNLEIIPSENRIEKHDVHYPEELFKNNLSRLDYSRITVDDNHIYSFNSHDIHIWDGNKMKSKQAKSSILPDKLPKIAPDLKDIKLMLNFALFTEGYGSILYDSYQKVYYRFAFGGREEEVPMNKVLDELLYPKIQSIIVLDSNFKKIDELILPENKYVLKLSFIKEDGLYVSTYNPKSDSIVENEWGFRKFVLRKGDD